MFGGLALAFFFWAERQYGLLRIDDRAIGWVVSDSIHYLSESGWGVVAGVLVAMFGAYRLLSAPKSD